jgi:hypothetical protein
MITVVMLLAVAGYFLKREPVVKEGQWFAVVELFSSEGCSSCPAADRVLARIAADYPQHVYTLEFHVDYWNRLGWTDPFSDAAFSERQRRYSSSPEGDGVYTPQAIVNGTKHVVGSNEPQLRKWIDASAHTPSHGSIELATTLKDDHHVLINCSFEKGTNTVLNIALVQLSAQTQVKSGENGGRSLSHSHIVRDFKTVTADKKSVELEIPGALVPKDCAIIAYTQNTDTHAITGATGQKLTGGK